MKLFSDFDKPESPSLPKLPKKMRILPYPDGVLFPSMLLPMEITAEHQKKVVEDAVSSDRIIAVFATKQESKNKDKNKDEKNPELYKIGSGAMILRMLRIPDGSMQVMLQGIQRVKLNKILQTEPYMIADVEPLKDKFEHSIEFEGMMRTAVNQFYEIIKQAPNLPPEIATIVNNLSFTGQQIDFIASNLKLKKEEQQQILELIDIHERLKLLLTFIERELEILKIGTKIHEDVQQTVNKAQREAYLRQQLESIKKELGESDEQTAALNELQQKIEKANLPEEVRKVADRELKRMAQIPPMSPEYNVSRTYLDWIVSLPWDISTEDRLEVDQAQQVLDEDHHDLEKLKERIVDYLAVRKLKQDMKGPILCFVGPPGTGKTSLGKSIARALGRTFMRLSLGGVRDEAEIRGHRRTYIGALPGRIIQSLQRASSNNPVIMLDEIDKVGTDYRGDPSSALLEVLDPEQNNSFVDHYLDLPFDLSKVFFITTANIVDTIPPPLLDRMEVLELSGYTEPDKLEISKRYLVPKQLKEHALKETDVIFDDSAIVEVIRSYTREAGVRNLERNLATLCRKSTRQIVTGTKPPIKITGKEVRDILGPERYLHDAAEEKDEVGVVVGMAWTPVGGDILFVEATVVEGNGHLRLTGRLGDVMKESAEAAMTYVRSRSKKLGLPDNFHRKKDVHVHIPEGAIPKDGPSAGVTMTTALVSALTKRPARRDIAMTGEITLRGKVLAVGGIRDKVLAAHRAGIKTIILPKENQRNLEDIPEHVKNELQFFFVEHLDEVLDKALKLEGLNDE